jgi:hypothetical protein
MQKNILHIQNKRTRRLVRNFNRPSAFSMNPALVNHSKSGLRVQLYKTKSYIQSSLNGKSIQSKFYFLPKQCAMFFKKFRALYKVMENFFKILAASKVYTYTVILIQLSILALLGLQLYFAVSISWDGFSIVNWILLTKICLLYGVSITYVVEALLRSLNSLVMTYPDNKNKLTSLNLLKISLVLLALFFCSVLFKMGHFTINIACMYNGNIYWDCSYHIWRMIPYWI